MLRDRNTLGAILTGKDTGDSASRPSQSSWVFGEDQSSMPIRNLKRLSGRWHQRRDIDVRVRVHALRE